MMGCRPMAGPRSLKPPIGVRFSAPQRACSQAGKAPALQAGQRRFESGQVHTVRSGPDKKEARGRASFLGVPLNGWQPVSKTGVAW